MYKYFVQFINYDYENISMFISAPREVDAISIAETEYNAMAIREIVLVLENPAYNRTIHIDFHDCMYTLKADRVICDYAKSVVDGWGDMQYEKYIELNMPNDFELIEFIQHKYSVGYIKVHGARMYVIDQSEMHNHEFMNKDNFKIN